VFKLPDPETRHGKNTTDVALEPFGKDKYGRTIADVLLPDGTNFNHALVLVVQKVCAEGCDSRRIGNESKNCQDRAVG
jgi:endonuclease YncB( thermonuclease family)